MTSNQPFSFDKEGCPITIEELFRESYELRNEMIRYHLREQSEIRVGISASLPAGEVHAQTTRGKRFIETINFEATFYNDVTTLPSLTPISYVDEDGKKITSFSQTNDPSTELGVTIQFDWDDDGERLNRG